MPTRPPTPCLHGTRDPWFDNAKMALVTLVVVGSLVGRCCPTRRSSTTSTTSSTPGTCRRSSSSPATSRAPSPGPGSGCGSWSARSPSRTSSSSARWRCSGSTSAASSWRTCSRTRTGRCGTSRRCSSGGCSPRSSSPCGAGWWWRWRSACVAGMYAGDTLDLARVLGLLPFFVMGLKATPERLELLRSQPARVAAVGVLVAIWVLTTWTDRWASTEWLYYRSRYDEMGYADDLHAIVTRALVLVVGTLGAWAFFALVPRLNGWFTRMGAWTLVVYLFHGFVVKGAEYTGYPAWAEDHAAVALGLTTALAVLLALFLAWTPVATRLDVLVDPLGHAEQHLHRTVDLAVAKDEVLASRRSGRDCRLALRAHGTRQGSSSERRALRAPRRRGGAGPAGGRLGRRRRSGRRTGHREGRRSGGRRHRGHAAVRPGRRRRARAPDRQEDRRRLAAQQAVLHPARCAAAEPVPSLAADPDPDGRRHLSLLRGRREDLGPDQGARHVGSARQRRSARTPRRRSSAAPYAPTSSCPRRSW